MAIVYLLGSSNAATLPFHWIASLGSQPQATEADYPCAGHGCGCRTAEQCRTACCCFPNIEKANRRSDAEDGMRPTLRKDSYCAGLPSDKGVVNHKPSAPEFLTKPLAPVSASAESELRWLRLPIPRQVFPDPPDKIPI